MQKEDERTSYERKMNMIEQLIRCREDERTVDDTHREDERTTDQMRRGDERKVDEILRER